MLATRGDVLITSRLAASRTADLQRQLLTCCCDGLETVYVGDSVTGG